MGTRSYMCCIVLYCVCVLLVSTTLSAILTDSLHCYIQSLKPSVQRSERNPSSSDILIFPLLKFLLGFVSVSSSLAGNANEVSAYGMCVSRSLEEDRE